MKNLPEDFEDLERWVESWALPDTNGRHRKRASSAMDELRAFYDGVGPRLAEALAYLDSRPWPIAEAADRRLLDLMLMLADVALAVEKYGEPMLEHAQCSIDFVADTSALDQAPCP